MMGSPDTTVLPIGWVESSLGQLCDVITDGTHHTPRYVVRGVPFYSVESVTNDDFENVKHISVEEHRALVRRCRPQRGDILMTRIGSLADTKLIDWDVEASIYVSLALLRPGRVIDGRYLYAFTKSRRFVKAVEDRSLLWAIPKKINMGDIAHVTVLVPADRAEQRVIADAVLCAERYVRELERLIAKKQAIKQGMMQQLLTGQTRLPGFTESWQERSLGDLAAVDPETLAGGTDPRTVINYISLEDVQRGEILGHSEVNFGSAPSRARRVVRKRDVLFGTVRPNLQSHALYIGGLKRPIASTGFAVVRPGQANDSSFVFYLLMSHLTSVQIERIIAGSNYPAVSSRDVRRLIFSFPSLDEQRAIRRVLAECDREVLLLKHRLTKAKAVKEGMVQELLTGRTRLPIGEAAS